MPKQLRKATRIYNTYCTMERNPEVNETTLNRLPRFEIAEGGASHIDNEKSKIAVANYVKSKGLTIQKIY